MQEHIYVAEKLKELDRMPRHIIASARHLASNDTPRLQAFVAAARRAGHTIRTAIWPRPSKAAGDECGC